MVSRGSLSGKVGATLLLVLAACGISEADRPSDDVLNWCRDHHVGINTYAGQSGVDFPDAVTRYRETAGADFSRERYQELWLKTAERQYYGVCQQLWDTTPSMRSAPPDPIVSE